MNQKEAMFALSYVMKETEEIIENNKKKGKYFSSAEDTQDLVEAINFLEDETGMNWSELYKDLCDYITKQQWAYSQEKIEESDLYYSIILTNAINKILGGEN